MPISEAALDAPRDLVATRYLELTDTLRGVRFERGVALDPMGRATAERLRMILGPDFIIVGPWSPPATVPTPPLASSPPPAPAVVASEPEVSTLRAPTRRLRRTP